MSADRHPFEILPDWVGETLRQPVSSSTESRSRIMDRIRRQPAPRRHSPPMRPSRWVRRGLLSPVGGFMTTTMLALALCVRAGIGGGATELVTATRILADTVVPTRSVISANHWLDTMRIVEFVIRGSAVRAAVVLGDFNHWQRGATPLVSTGRHEWRARVLVPRDALNVAYLVNDSQFIPTASLAQPE